MPVIVTRSVHPTFPAALDRNSSAQSNRQLAISGEDLSLVSVSARGEFAADADVEKKLLSSFRRASVGTPENPRADKKRWQHDASVPV
jgi:hypothetical protein